jgi:uncharacterized membrane protein YtjA (UPF0391 family)
MLETVIAGPAGNRPTEPNPFFRENLTMLRLAIVFLVVALIAAFLGFGGVERLAWDGAKILFFIFLILAVLSYLGGTYRGRSFWQ